MKEDSELFLIDSNILIYAFSKEEDFKNKKAKEIVNRCWSGKAKFAISNQNLAEFIFVATRKSKLDFGEAKIITNLIINFDGFEKINYSSATILSAIDIANEFKMSFWDSLLTATMKEHKIFNIYTENTKDFKIPWIKAVNPLK